TFWIGALAGVLVFWRRRGLRWGALTCGALVGAAVGFFAAAALGCGLLVLDRVPMTVWGWFSGVPLYLAGDGRDGQVLAWWVAAAGGTWMAAGAVLAVVLLGLYRLAALVITLVGRGLSGLVRLSGGKSREVFGLEQVRRPPVISE